MDEIKNTAEVEEQKNTLPETASAETQEVEQAAVSPAETEVPTVEDEAVQTENNSTEDNQTRPDPTCKAEVIERLKEIVKDGGKADRTELDHLKMLYYRFHNALAMEQRSKFIEEGGNPEDFIPTPDHDEESFKAQMALIRDLRNKAAQALEAEKQANLKRKQEIIERIKEAAATPEDADKGFNDVKDMQAEWKEIGQVPAEFSTELWKNYQLYVEQFYDQLRLNHEMRAYDFKKNLEIKTHLCESAEKLADVEDPISAFHQLQTLHKEYRETGPVAKELRDEIWKRFKDASTVINKRHQEHFEALKAQEAENLQKKTELCMQVEALSFDSLKTYSQWEEMTKQVLAYQAEWKTVGFIPRKANNEIFERFRIACDRFFQAKTAYFKESRERLNANLAAKTALVEKAEALKDSTDWGATTNKLVDLQRQWKEIGPVSHKVSDSIWKRFNDACNHFFNHKNEANAEQRKEEDANLTLKKAVLDELTQLVENPVEDLLQSVKDLQARWNEIGHVPYNKKEKMYRCYRDLCDKIYGSLHETAGRRRMDNFRNKVAEKGGSELTRERTRLQNAYESKKQEIQTYETNLTFFRTSSKKGNSLLADAEKRVERLKQELEELSLKIKTVNEQIKAESK